MIRTFTVSLSPVVPTDNVRERHFHQSDNTNTEKVFLLDPTVTSFAGQIDEAVAPGSYYLIDVNDAGSSAPSPSKTLAPTPTPPPGNVPTTPTVGDAVWTN